MAIVKAIFGGLCVLMAFGFLFSLCDGGPDCWEEAYKKAMCEELVRLRKGMGP